MSSAVLASFEQAQMKGGSYDVRPGETVKVHYKIREGGKERIQIFEGLVIGTKATKSLQGSFTVRKVVDTIGVERTFPLHSPWVTKVERIKSGKVRRAKLNYVRNYALSRRFKLKDTGVAGTVWDKPAPEKPVEVRDEPDTGSQLPQATTDSTADEVADVRETGENKPDDHSGQADDEAAAAERPAAGR